MQISLMKKSNVIRRNLLGERTLNQVEAKPVVKSR